MASKSSMRSSRGSKSSSSSVLWVMIGILIIAILLIIFMSNYKFFEKFTNPMAKLQYFYMEECGYCKEFKPTWDEIVAEVAAKPTLYNFTTEKYDIQDGGAGKALADTLKVTGVPTISFVSADGSKRTFFDLYRTKDNVLKFAVDNLKVSA
jgi:thiol-disulfide isomerase/thioredoxin